MRRSTAGLATCDDDAAEKDRKYVTALARGLEILNCFQPGDRFLGNTQIAERTGLPKATVCRLAYTLCEHGFLACDENTNKYRLSTAIASLSHALLAQMDIRRIARPLMQALAEHTQAAVNLGLRDRLNMVYIDTYRNASTYAVQLDIGSQIPLATTSMGRAYLATLPEPRRVEIIEQIRIADPKEWPRIQEGIAREIENYRQKGFCLSLGEWRREVHAIAVPLATEDGSDIMVFSCSGASFQLPPSLLEENIGPRLLNLAGNVKSAMKAGR